MKIGLRECEFGLEAVQKIGRSQHSDRHCRRRINLFTFVNPDLDIWISNSELSEFIRRLVH